MVYFQAWKLYCADFDTERSEFGGNTRRDSGVCDDAMQVRGICDMDVTAFIEFGGIEDRNHFRRLLDHDLVEERFFKACCRDAAFDIERVHTEEEFVSAEVS